MFTSRHEAMHSTVHTEDASTAPAPSSPTPPAPASGDTEEAEAVRHRAQQHERSDSDTDSETRTTEDKPAMYVFNSPSSALHKATPESTDAYFQDRTLSAQTLKPKCGCVLGIATMAVWTAQPGNTCRRKVALERPAAVALLV